MFVDCEPTAAKIFQNVTGGKMKQSVTFELYAPHGESRGAAIVALDTIDAIIVKRYADKFCVRIHTTGGFNIENWLEPDQWSELMEELDIEE